jgi:hypothetical protein
MRYRHKKTGGHYVIHGTAKLQTAEPVGDMTEVVIYYPEDANPFDADTPLCARPIDEFFDGRFEEIPDAEPDTPDALTAEERAAFRPVRLQWLVNHGPATVGLQFAHRGSWQAVRFALTFWRRSLALTFQTFADYEKTLLAAGRYRHF